MITLIELFIFFLTLIVIGLPIFWKSRKQLKLLMGEGDPYQELLFRKDSAYTAIKDLEFDYQSGKLTSEDYHKLREQFEREAIQLLEKIDRLKKEQGVSGFLPSQPPPKKNFCTECGTVNSSLNKFCFACGTKLKSE